MKQVYNIFNLEYFSYFRFVKVNQAIVSNGSTKYTQSTMRKSPNSLYSQYQDANTMTMLPLSGNLQHPAEQLRYFRIIQFKLLMVKVRPIWWQLIN